MNKKKGNEKKESKKEYIYSSIIIMLIPIPFVYLFFDDVYGRWLSVQLFVILAGTGIIIAFLVARLFNKVKVEGLNSEVAKLYFSSTSNFILAIFAGFGIAFSILWGSLYTYAISKEKLQEYIIDLKLQGIILLIFLLCASAAMYLSFLLPLIKQIKDEGK